MAEPATPPRLLLMSVSVLLGNLLRGALTSLGNLRVISETNPLSHEGETPELVLVEVTIESESWVYKLLERGGSAPIVLIGPLSGASERPKGPRESAPPREVRELSADVSVAEIVRVCGEYLGSVPRQSHRSMRSLPSSPYEFEVVPRDSAAGLPSIQAPLFPVSAPPSSHPSKRPSSGAPAAGSVAEDSDSAGFELDPELSSLLAQTEARVASELSPRLTSPPDPAEEGARSGRYFLSPEVRNALEEPVERYHDKNPREPSHHSGTPNSHWATRTGTSHARHADAAASSATGDLPPPVPTSVGSGPGTGTARAAMETSSDNQRPVSLEPHPNPSEADAGISTRPPPPAISRKALLVPAVPPPPALPHDPWHELERNTPADAETIAPSVEPQSLEPDFSNGLLRDARPTQQPRLRNSVKQAASPEFPGPTAPTATRDTAQPSSPEFEAPAALPRAPMAREPVAREPIAREPIAREPIAREPIAREPSARELGAKRASELPPLGEGDMVGLLARAIRTRYTGAIVIEADGGVRRLVLRDGDFVTSASGLSHESLLAFLVSQGTLGPQVAHRLEHRLPNFGRHAGAALIAAGHLTQEQLWPCLRSHAESIIAATLRLASGTAGFEDQIAERLANEPAVFGGATGAEVFVELVRRVVPPDVAIERLGGLNARLTEGPAVSLIDECALSREEAEAISRHIQASAPTVGDLVGATRIPGFPSALYGLTQLRVLNAEPSKKPAAAPKERDSLDEQAVRELVANRKALVEEGDYFQLLGLTPHATAYDIRRAYLDLKRTFQPSALMAVATSDLREDVDLICLVLDEAYDILHDHTRRERYRRALLSSPQ